MPRRSRRRGDKGKLGVDVIVGYIREEEPQLRRIETFLQSEVGRFDMNSRTAVGGLTALHWACRRNYRDAVKLLLHHGADPFVTDNFLSTPAHHAALTGSRDALEELLDECANIASRDELARDMTGSDNLSQQHNNTNNYNDDDTGGDDGDLDNSNSVGRYFGVIATNSGAVKPKNPAGRQSNHRGPFGFRSTGHEFISPTTVHDIVHTRNASGETPLHCALASGHRTCAALLIDAGAEMDETTVYGCNVLDMSDSVTKGAVLLAIAERNTEIEAKEELEKMYEGVTVEENHPIVFT